MRVNKYRDRYDQGMGEEEKECTPILTRPNSVVSFFLL